MISVLVYYINKLHTIKDEYAINYDLKHTKRKLV